MRRVRNVSGPIVLGVLALGSATSAAWLRLDLPIPSCTFREWTGLPCATCGTTRLVRALVTGEIVCALALNPLIFCGIVLTAAWGAFSTARSVFDLPAPRLGLGQKDRARLVLVAAAAVIANWIYLLLRGI